MLNFHIEACFNFGFHINDHQSGSDTLKVLVAFEEEENPNYRIIMALYCLNFKIVHFMFMVKSATCGNKCYYIVLVLKYLNIGGWQGVSIAHNKQGYKHTCGEGELAKETYLKKTYVFSIYLYLNICGVCQMITLDHRGEGGGVSKMIT